MRKLAIASLLLLTTCSGPDENDYCAGFGLTPDNPEYTRCVSYYFQEEAAFKTDRISCDFEADKTYPPSLYSTPQDIFLHGGYGPYGWYGGEIVHTGADYQLNAQLDQLRMRIIQPCMQAKGWNSGASWQAGHHAVKAPVKVQPKKTTGNQLPWLTK